MGLMSEKDETLVRFASIEELPDDALAVQAAEWRRRALHGEDNANGRAHLLERELRRRSGALSTLSADLRAPAERHAPWWAFWRR